MRTHPSYGRMDSASMPLRPYRAVRAAAVVAVLCLTSSALFAQPSSSANDPRRRGTTLDEAAARRGASPQDMQVRMLSALRERLGVTDDEEWALISERLMKVAELRRGLGDTAGGFRGASPAAAAAAARAGRGTGAGRTPEIESLQAAVSDRLPEAEIKLRLAKVRQARRAQEAALEKAQEQLRAVLTIRQEAVAVLFGLLP